MVVVSFNWEMIQSMKPEGIVIDVGKGSIYGDAVTKAIKHDIKIMRCDKISCSTILLLRKDNHLPNGSAEF